MRGESERNNHLSQWMGFYGSSSKFSPYKRSRAFVSKYGSIAHYKALKDLKLLYVPYASLYMADSRDIRAAAGNIESILRYLSQTKPMVYKKHGVKKIQATLLEFFLADPTDSNIGLSQETIASYIQNKPLGNPDYLAQEVLCAIGIDGWVRTATAYNDAYAPFASDEIMLCNTPSLMRRGYIKRDDTCHPVN